MAALSREMIEESNEAECRQLAGIIFKNLSNKISYERLSLHTRKRDAKFANKYLFDPLPNGIIRQRKSSDKNSWTPDELQILTVKVQNLKKSDQKELAYGKKQSFWNSIDIPNRTGDSCRLKW